MTRTRDEDYSQSIRRLLRVKIIEVRALQLMGGLQPSDVFKIISKVYRETGANTTNVFLINLIRDLELQERRERQ